MLHRCWPWGSCFSAPCPERAEEAPGSPWWCCLGREILKASGSPRGIPGHSINIPCENTRNVHSQPTQAPRPQNLCRPWDSRAHSSLRSTDLSLGYTREEGDLILPALCVPVECGRGQGELCLRAWEARCPAPAWRCCCGPPAPLSALPTSCPGSRCDFPGKWNLSRITADRTDPPWVSFLPCVSHPLSIFGIRLSGGLFGHSSSQIAGWGCFSSVLLLSRFPQHSRVFFHEND